MAVLLCLFVVALCSAWDATCGPVHTGQALYQLNYIPALHFDTGFHRPDFEKLSFAYLGDRVGFRGCAMHSGFPVS